MTNAHDLVAWKVLRMRKSIGSRKDFQSTRPFQLESDDCSQILVVNTSLSMVDSIASVPTPRPRTITWAWRRAVEVFEKRPKKMEKHVAATSTVIRRNSRSLRDGATEAG